MNILSEPSRDTRTGGQPSGGYEWWYFDAVSVSDRYSFVIIFYEGNPFSTRYIKAMEEKKGPASQSISSPVPSDYPAVSISIYEQGDPIYYSFTEFDETDCFFSEERPFLEIGSHQMESTLSEDQLSYSLSLKEELPSGDWLKAEITFESPLSTSLFGEYADHSEAGHHWNLVQPRAEVSGVIQTGGKDKSLEDRTFTFRGTGYHDHNRGEEPMHEEFTEWYWGRCHFDYATLVYYVTNRKGEQHHQAWLIHPSGARVITSFSRIEISDKSLSLFGLYTGRKLSMHANNNENNPEVEVQVQQSEVIDNGPFYQRFISEGYLSVPGSRVLESTRGITEYIYPGRIYARFFWPLVSMRIRQAHEKPHWVQRSKRLYRWTW